MKEFENFIHYKFGYCYYSWDKKSPAIIYNLFIYPKFRNKGFAKKLLHIVINEIRLLGYNGIIEIEATPTKKDIKLKRLKKLYESFELKIIKE